MTLRTLFEMAWGKAKEQRRLIVAQATLVWCAASRDQVAEFIATGYLDCEAPGEEPPMPYDPELLASIVNRGRD